MRALYCEKGGGLALVDIPEPEICNDDDVKIKIAYSSICGFDIMQLNGVMDVIPGILGHEASGVIVELGKRAEERFSIGDRVTFNIITNCSNCDYCINGMPYYCMDSYLKAPTMTEYAIQSSDNVYLLPTSVSLKSGCLTEPLSVCIHALSKANDIIGKKILILGAGGTGLIMVQLAKLFPFSQVVAMDRNEEKRKLAVAMGADDVIDPHTENLYAKSMDLTKGMGFDVIIEMTGDQDVMSATVPVIARGGTIVFFALYGMKVDLHLNLFELYYKDAQIHGVFPKGNFYEALSVLPKLDLESVITAEYPFSKAVDAYRAKQKGGQCKVMVCMGEK